MVFVWSKPVRWRAHFTLSQVALNDAIMVVAFAPIVGLLLGLSAITVPWDTLLLSVVLYIVIPVIVAQLMRRILLAPGATGARSLLAVVQPLSLVALLLTLVLLFGFQGEQIIAQPLVIALLAVPILIQVYFNAGLAYLLNRAWASALRGRSVGADRRLELLRARRRRRDQPVRLQSGAALATVVGVLVEVPVMLSVVCDREPQHQGLVRAAYGRDRGRRHGQ
jgi:ACR3 family arsenite transporter